MLPIRDHQTGDLFDPWEHLGEEARAELQGKVDAYDAAFVADVARGRGVTEGKVRREFGQGRLENVSRRAELGMVQITAQGNQDRV